MKPLLYIIVGMTILLSALPPAFGCSLFNRGESHTFNRWPYSFGDRYIYDNGGSSWNYDSPNEHGRSCYYCNHRHKKHRFFRFEYTHKRSASEKLDRLIKHFTRNSSRHNEPFHSKSPPHNDHIGRRCMPDIPMYPLQP